MDRRPDPRITRRRTNEELLHAEIPRQRLFTDRCKKSRCGDSGLASMDNSQGFFRSSVVAFLESAPGASFGKDMR